MTRPQALRERTAAGRGRRRCVVGGPALPAVLPQAVLLLAMLLLAARPAAAVQNDLVPHGVWSVETGLRTRTDTSAFNHARDDVPLLGYVADGEAFQGALLGHVERTWHRAEVKLRYGLSDTWNLSLKLPYVDVKQTSTVSATSGDPAVLARAQTLRPRSLGGPGSAELLSLHRPVFSDRHALVLGYGVRWPMRNPASPWTGRGTLLLGSPFRAALGLLSYTYFPSVERTRLDLRAALSVSETRELAQEGGGSASVNPGNRLDFELKWGQEFGRLATAFGVSAANQGNSSISKVSQGDSVTEIDAKLMLGWGNLVELEQRPVSFPYQVRFTYEHTLLGAGVPQRQEFGVELQFYF